ncbi:MAG: secretin N-terminal domain-containing protein [Spirochaetota bacterium]|nr:secretin N-terminal domain-containing protein [Spirochaetota bacterium]OPZ37231.1 MAG: Type II secretion system protein D precursor [Spirochaetes bacterium ADurb.BinA120]HPI14796.1 secretin N-terminal domain-containing protein [Spirochaetota bacterium]HPV97222.1 secretin N-terminal domain-containing protein [Spirochaetota bacterium]
MTFSRLPRTVSIITLILTCGALGGPRLFSQSVEDGAAEAVRKPVVETPLKAGTENPVTPEEKASETPANPPLDRQDGPRKAPKIDRTEKYFTLNFKDVELAEFLNIMSQLIKKNIMVDEKVRGKITISSAKRIPVAQAFDILKSILEIKGFAVIETENLIKVVPIKDAIKKNVEIIVDKDGAAAIPAEDRTITYLLQVDYADANEIANVLRQLKSNDTDLVVYPPLNTIILSGNAKEIGGLTRISRSLDRKIEEIKDDRARKGNIHVIHLENADAEKLAAVLSRIPFSETAKIDTSPITPAAGTTPPQQAPAVRRSDRTARVTQTQQTAPPSASTQKLSIIANKETNSLIISATPQEFAEIERIVNELDTVREQVYIETLIVEVNAQDGWSLGIDWMMGDQSGKHIYGGSSIMGAPPSYTPPSGLGGKTLAVPAATGFQLGYLADRSILGYILLNATGIDNKYNILSTPQILTLDNQEAEINVGEEIPVPTNNRISDTGVQFYTYEYKTVGVKLKITPHITQKNRITLDLYQEVNSVTGTTTVSPTGTVIPPELGKRDIKTKITVHDGKTIVVGGLIRNNSNVEETKVPILGDIPLLGWFFKRKTVQNTKTNLLVFITPHVVTRPDRAEALTDQKREAQRRVRGR